MFRHISTMEPIMVEECIQTDEIKSETPIKTEYIAPEIIKPESIYKPSEFIKVKSEDEEDTFHTKFEEVIQIKSENEDECEGFGGNLQVDVKKEITPIKTEAFEVKTEGVNKDKVFPGIFWDSTRRSAFQPYKPTTVLTNLQRGNIQTKTPVSDSGGFTWFEKAGRGDISENDVKKVQDINAVDIHGFSALMWSAAYGQDNAVLLLLENGADVHLRGKQLETAMHLAAAGGHQEVIRHLIAFGADPDIFDEEGNTPLIYAVHGDHPHAVQELLQEGASMFDPDCYNYAVLKECSQAQFVMESHIVSMLCGESQ